MAFLISTAMTVRELGEGLVENRPARPSRLAIIDRYVLMPKSLNLAKFEKAPAARYN